MAVNAVAAVLVFIPRDVVRCPRSLAVVVDRADLPGASRGGVVVSKPTIPCGYT